MSNITLIPNTSNLMDDADYAIYISKSQLQKVTFVLAVLLIPLFCLLGSIGNSLSLVVLFNQRMRNQTNYILAALCVSDTIFLIHSLIYTGLNVYKKMNPIAGESLRARVYPIVGAYGSVVAGRITSCLTTLLCAERFVAVFFPMKAKTICSKRNTGISIAGIYLITLLVFIPFCRKYEAVENYVNENFTFISMNKTSFYKNNLKFYQVYGTTLNIIFRFAPLLVIPFLNALMIRIVHRTWKQRTRMSADNGHIRVSSRNGKHGSYTDQSRITIMLLTVSFVFLVCILPGAVNSLVTHFVGTYNRLGKLRNLYMVISTVTYLLETINSSVNFIIYMAFSRKFRLLYKETFCCGHGQYYHKLSISSVKERFRWSSSKLNNKPSVSQNCLRQTVSDIGPATRDYRLKDNTKTRTGEVHSEGFDVQRGEEIISLEDYYAHNDENIKEKNDCCCADRFNRKSFRNLLFLRSGTNETSLSIDIDTVNNVICKLEVCPQTNGLIRGTANS